MDDAATRQTSLYGAPLADIVATVRQSLGLTQARVAQVLGVSAPMLSQLVGGQRVKIGNPLVVERLDRLRHLAAEAARMTTGDVERALAEIAAVDATTRHGTPDPARRQEAGAEVSGVLRAVASGRDLLDAAALLEERHPGLAEVLRVYGTGSADDVRRHLASIEALLDRG